MPWCPHDKNDSKTAKLLEVNRLVMAGLNSEQIARKLKKEVRYVDYWKKKYLENPMGYKL
jgi:DNA-binding NarL/FixJ family response regulator